MSERSLKEHTSGQIGSGIDVEKLQKSLEGNEELAGKLESALSNQEAAKAAFKKLLEEKVTLQKHHDDMKIKYEETELGRVTMQAELETVNRANEEQREQIGKLEMEIKILKEGQGDNEVVKDLQDRLIRLSNEQEGKDKTIHGLQRELDATKTALKNADSGRVNENEGSKVCDIM